MESHPDSSPRQTNHGSGYEVYGFYAIKWRIENYLWKKNAWLPFAVFGSVRSFLSSKRWNPVKLVGNQGQIDNKFNSHANEFFLCFADFFSCDFFALQFFSYLLHQQSVHFNRTEIHWVNRSLLVKIKCDIVRLKHQQHQSMSNEMPNMRIIHAQKCLRSLSFSLRIFHAYKVIKVQINCTIPMTKSQHASFVHWVWYICRRKWTTRRTREWEIEK